MSSQLYQSIIIGAGAAGLAAAAELARHRTTALVLEARLHIGGRIWTHHEPGLAVPLELGAEFIHGRAAPTFALLAKSATAAVDAPEEHWTLRSGKLEPANDLFLEVTRAMRRSRALEREDMSFARYLGRLGSALSDDARRYAHTLVEGFDAANPRRASASAIVSEWTGGSSVDEPQFRPLGGYGRLASRLAAELRGSEVTLQLNTTVETVRWKRRAVEIDGTFLGRPFSAGAQSVIVTLPLGVLQNRANDSGAVRFIPALAQKRGALKRLAAG